MPYIYKRMAERQTITLSRREIGLIHAALIELDSRVREGMTHAVLNKQTREQINSMREAGDFYEDDARYLLDKFFASGDVKKVEPYKPPKRAPERYYVQVDEEEEQLD